ncbi:PilN domain-containing protein [Caldimonas brevitalea]|uniref:General secretion pathway protein L n=1 Tax=Caldimonas brevitalea TaxID=413882 RepID=A0A0G3BP09_9BURK|nr:PilN domain-containing protein [Caldimonas brevitalea]AKJ29728.1 general secretion pathway protein L [Caldimonas brevitalea]
MQTLVMLLRERSRFPVSLLATGLRWWRDELIGLVEPVLERFGWRSVPPRLLMTADGELHLAAAPEAKLSHGQAASTGSSDWQTVCRGRQTFVCLDPSAVLTLSLRLPRAAAARLREAAGYRLITESPLPPEQICFDVRPAPSLAHSSPRRHELDVEVALCTRERLRALGERLDAAGVQDHVIGYGTQPDGRPAFVFQTSGAAQQGSGSARRHRLLVASALLVSLAALPLTYLGAHWLAQRAEQDIRALRAAQDGVMKLYEQEAVVRAARDELHRQTGGAQLAAVLDDVARHLPASAWLHTVRLEQGSLKLAGSSSEPAAVARALEASRRVRQVKLEAVTATTTSPDEKAVQFELSALLADPEQP